MAWPTMLQEHAPHLIAAGEQEVEDAGVALAQELLPKVLILLVKLQDSELPITIPEPSSSTHHRETSHEAYFGILLALAVIGHSHANKCNSRRDAPSVCSRQ